jgi:hypothetical protein
MPIGHPRGRPVGTERRRRDLRADPYRYQVWVMGAVATAKDVVAEDGFLSVQSAARNHR